jgi:hypothetical protein
MAREDSEPEKTGSELAGTHFTIGKIIFRRKFQVPKGPKLEELRKSAEFQADFPT